MVKLWFPERDLRYRWSEVKRVFWDDLEDHLNLAAKRLLEAGLRAERSIMLEAGRYCRTSKRKDYSNGYSLWAADVPVCPSYNCYRLDDSSGWFD